MGPNELAIIGLIGLLLFCHRLIPKWGRALGEAVGVWDAKTED